MSNMLNIPSLFFRSSKVLPFNMRSIPQVNGSEVICNKTNGVFHVPGLYYMVITFNLLITSYLLMKHAVNRTF